MKTLTIKFNGQSEQASEQAKLIAKSDRDRGKAEVTITGILAQNIKSNSLFQGDNQLEWYVQASRKYAQQNQLQITIDRNGEYKAMASH